MAHDNITEEILGNLVTTVEQRDELVWKLEEVEKTLFTKTFSLNSFLGTLPYTLSDPLKIMVTENDFKTNDAVHVFLGRLKDTVMVLPIISITVAITPTGQLLHSMQQWFLDTYKKAVVFAITVDPELIGGAVIGSNGRLKDYSLRSKIQEEYIHG